MQWQVAILLFSCVANLTDLNVSEILIKCSKVEQIENFSCEILQELQQLFAPIVQKPGR